MVVLAHINLLCQLKILASVDTCPSPVIKNNKWYNFFKITNHINHHATSQNICNLSKWTPAHLPEYHTPLHDLEIHSRTTGYMPQDIHACNGHWLHQLAQDYYECVGIIPTTPILATISKCITFYKL